MQRQDQPLQQVLPQAAQAPKPEPEKRKITWASVASQPAKPVAPISLTQGTKKKTGIAPPPIIPGKHNMDIGTWGDSKSIPPPKVPPPPSPPTVQPPLPSPQPPVQRQPPQQQRQDQRGPPMQSVWNRQPQSPPSPSAQIQAMHHQQHQQQQQHHHQQYQHQQHSQSVSNFILFHRFLLVAQFKCLLIF